MHVVINDVI